MQMLDMNMFHNRGWELDSREVLGFLLGKIAGRC